MATASVAVTSRSRPSTMKMVLEAMRDEDGKNGVSVMEIKRRIREKYPEKQEKRLNTDMKKVFEKALNDGTIERVKKQSDAGSALTGSFRIVTKKPPAKAKATERKPPAAENKSATTTKAKTAAPKSKMTDMEMKAGDKKPAAKRKPTTKAPVKKAASATSTASTASVASSASAASADSDASFNSFDSMELSPPTSARRGPVPQTPPLSPTEQRPAAPKQKKAQGTKRPTGKENVPPGGKAAGKKQQAPSAAELAALLALAAVKPVQKKTKAKPSAASKVAGK